MKKIFTLISLFFLATCSYSQSQCWAKIASTGAHTVAIAHDGTLWSWGFNMDGRLGLGDLLSRAVPTQIGTDNDWESVSATAAIKRDGSLWVWGRNNYGQLGLGWAGDDVTSPRRLGNETSWKTVSIGHASHSLAIKNDGTLWAWGYGATGRLGTGNSSNRSTPIRIGNATNWKSIAVGSNHSFATRTDSTLWAWGRNVDRELGISIETDFRSVPTERMSKWLSVAAGNESYGIAVRYDGTLWGWGKNGRGQLGIGSADFVWEPTQAGTDNNWKKVAIGDSSSFGLKNDGTLWTWGNNNNGQLGLGTADGQYNSPMRIGTETDWTDITAGVDFAVALKPSGQIYTWGINDLNQLGTGNTINRNIPAAVNCPSALLSVNDSDFLNLKLYPNPVKDNLTILMDADMAEIYIYDMLGQEILARNFNSSEEKIDVSSFKTGTYFVKVKTESSVQTYKIIKR